jgi:hypothetical protein
MLYAMLSIIFQCVVVLKEWVEMRSLNVDHSKVCNRILINYQWQIIQIIKFIDPIEVNPCIPSPCGPNSQCREINHQGVCSCVPGYIGSPPTCRPECVTSSECGQNEACSNQKCIDPCPGTCGVGAKCTVVNHNPICSCPHRMTGDPFLRCQPIRKDTQYNDISFRFFIIIYYVIVCSWKSNGTSSNQSLPTITLWSLFSMSCCRRFTIMLMSKRVYWFSTKL